MKCRDCGYENWSGTEFCVHCSAALYEKRGIK